MGDFKLASAWFGGGWGWREGGSKQAGKRAMNTQRMQRMEHGEEEVAQQKGNMHHLAL